MSLPSEPWIVLAKSFVYDYMVGAQLDALCTAALEAGQSDPWVNISTDVVTEIRSAIRGHPRNQVSLTALSIPPDLKRTALVLIAERLQLRIPGFALTEDQIRSGNEARQLIRDIRKGDVVITMPPDPMVPDDQQRGAPIAVVRADRRLFDRNKLRGL